MEWAQAVFTVLPVRLLGAVSSALGPLHGGGGTLHGDQLFDVLCVTMFGATIAFLRFLPAGTIYFWLKDLTQEFLKLHVVHGAVEIFDKVSHECSSRCRREAHTASFLHYTLDISLLALHVQFLDSPDLGGLSPNIPLV